MRLRFGAIRDRLGGRNDDQGMPANNRCVMDTLTTMELTQDLRSVLRRPRAR